MLDQDKSKQDIIEELAEMRRRVAVLETAETDRKQTEAALKKAHDELERRVEERTAELAKANENLEIFRKFAEDSDEGFGMADLDGHIVYANATLCRLFGEEKAEDVIGRSLSDYYLEEYMQRRTQQLLPALLREGHCQTEQTVLPRHGKPIQTLQNTFLIRDEAGSPFRTAVVISDITERKRTDEALRASEERFRVTFEEAPVGMVIGVGDGIITRANRAVCRMSGYTPEELIGRHVRDLTYLEDRQLSAPLVQKLMAGEIPSFSLEKRYLRKDGEPFWAQATTTIVHNPDGTIAFALGIVEDISERKRAEEALRQSEERFRIAFEEAPLGILMAVGDGVLVRANRTFCQMGGYTEEELLGSPVREITHPDDLERCEELSMQVMTGAIPGFATEKRFLKRDGGFFWAQLTVTAVRDRGGNVIFALGIIENITERRLAVETLQKEHRNLKHLLQSSDHERQLIAYEIHDGLAQQLAGALMQLQAYAHLKDKNPKEATKAYAAGLTMLQQGHFEARRLIAGVRPPILDEAGVAEAISHLIHEESRAKGPKIAYHSRVDFDRLDPTLENAIFRIAQEALTNACQHSQSKRISVSLLQRGDRLRIEIRDWGVGFDPLAVPKNHFGLEGIRQRARLLGGKCSIKSKPGKGARVVVKLPVVPKAEEG